MGPTARSGANSGPSGIGSGSVDSRVPELVVSIRKFVP